jgi:hypothetical protein
VSEQLLPRKEWPHTYRPRASIQMTVRPMVWLVNIPVSVPCQTIERMAPLGKAPPMAFITIAVSPFWTTTLPSPCCETPSSVRRTLAPETRW